MKILIIISILIFTNSITYDRYVALEYAKTYWNDLNHNCASPFFSCTPYSYWGGEKCGYGSKGGDSANFVSQCLLAGGHPHLNKGECRGYPCGKEEIDVSRLGSCLVNSYNWKSECGYKKEPPEDLQVGDILIYHSGSCDSKDSQAAFVVDVEKTENGMKVYIASHSKNQYDLYTKSDKEYYEWVTYPEKQVKPPDPVRIYDEKMVVVTSEYGIRQRAKPEIDPNNIIGSYVMGSRIQVIFKENNFYHDISGGYITAIDKYVADLTAVINTDGLNMRKGPSTNNPIIKVLYNGTPVKLLKKSGNWYYILSDSSKGWVRGDYLKFN